MNRRDGTLVLLGFIVGVAVTSLYWYGSRRNSQVIFDHNLKCQQIAKRFEADSNYRAGVLKVAYSPSRNSCVAEILKPYKGGVDYTVEDLLSGETIFYKRTKAPEVLDDKTLKEQEAKFVAATK